MTRTRRDILRLALETFGDKAAARGWLCDHLPMLGAAPRDLLATDDGRATVARVLGRIAHGVYS